MKTLTTFALAAALGTAVLAPASLAAQSVPMPLTVPMPPMPPTPAMLAALDVAYAPSGQANQATTVNSSGQLVIPLSHPSQPATLKVSSLNSNITVEAYNGTQVLVTAKGDDGHEWQPRHTPPEAQGMRLLNSNAEVSADEENNVVTVHSSVFGGGKSLTIQVPVHTSLSLSTVSGSIVVTGIAGDIDVKATNGRLTLNNVSGSVVAHALNGRLQATIAHLDTSKPSSFSSFNGTIDVTLPADIHANLAMRSDRGNIYLDNGFTFQPTAHASSAPKVARDDNGMYKVKLDNTIYGALNGGGPEIHFETFNGNIYVHKGH